VTEDQVEEELVDNIMTQEDPVLMVKVTTEVIQVHQVEELLTLEQEAEELVQLVHQVLTQVVMVKLVV
tara:strand:- start:110 stop:313 length:204 start_codon:yes stop_codon:yes gene_type:complete